MVALPRLTYAAGRAPSWMDASPEMQKRISCGYRVDISMGEGRLSTVELDECPRGKRSTIQDLASSGDHKNMPWAHVSYPFYLADPWHVRTSAGLDRRADAVVLENLEPEYGVLECGCAVLARELRIPSSPSWAAPVIFYHQNCPESCAMVSTLFLLSYPLALMDLSCS